MKNYFYFIFFALFATFLFACNEDDFLKEEPLDFMSGDNSYSTMADFETAATELYYLVRYEFYCNSDRSIDYLSGTDLMMGNGEFSNIATELEPSASIPKAHWDKFYLLIAQANVIISRIDGSKLTDEQKVKYEAIAKFFRGFAYRTLAYLYGGVPLQLEEVTAPKTNYVRSTYVETINQAIQDVKFASENLEDISVVKDGKISSSAAYHLLSELYLAAGQNQEAVDAATKVITNPALALMQNRFGARATTNGDVYWDLFQRNNQNRSSSNTEGIWVIQVETDVNGGGSKTTYYFWDNPGNYLLERYCSPQVQLFKFIMPDGTQLSPFAWPIGDYTGGRGIGSLVPAPHFYTKVWESDFNNDIRNSNYNFPRKFKFNNPDFIEKYGDIFGDSIDVMNPQLPDGVTVVTGQYYTTSFPNRYLGGYQTKCTTPYDHPAALYENANTYKLKGTAGGTYTDQYMFRLAETYLLRAEAYVKLGKTAEAATDINVVRSRANASPVAASNVDIDYILDERMRELGIEEKRRLTLSRSGADVYVDRVLKCNIYYTSARNVDGKDFQKTYTLYPIPQSVIEANRDAVLEQNPGY